MKSSVNATAGTPSSVPALRRRTALGGMLAWGAGMAGLGAGAAWAQARKPATLNIRWLGGGVAEIATPDYKQIAYCDAWVWNNSGWDRFGVQKPAEYASKEGFVQYVASKNPEAVFVLLTHDHGDHMGDYFEMLKALSDAGLPVKTTGQSDLMRGGLVEDFKKAGLDAATVSAWLNKQPWDKLVNRKGLTWRGLTDAQKAAIVDADSATALMLSNPSVIKRPVIVKGATVIVGYDADQYEQALT